MNGCLWDLAREHEVQTDVDLLLVLQKRLRAEEWRCPMRWCMRSEDAVRQIEDDVGRTAHRSHELGRLVAWSCLPDDSFLKNILCEVPVKVAPASHIFDAEMRLMEISGQYSVFGSII